MKSLWKTKITEALAPNAQLFIDVIPDLELIVGEQEAAPVLSPTEALNRFNIFFRKCVTVFTSAQTPLVIFLDDL